MSNEIVLFNSKFDLQQYKILRYLYDSVKVNSNSDGEKFIYSFTELYRLPIFKMLLDAILTECKNNKAIFIIKPLRNGDKKAGFCRTTVNTDKTNDLLLENNDDLSHRSLELIRNSSKFSRTFFRKHYEIVIKRNIPDTIIHEIAHAIEYLTEINLNADFRGHLFLDLDIQDTVNRQLKQAVEIIMKKELQYYKQEEAMSEYFARFFQLLAMSKEIGGWGDYQFVYSEVARYFYNTINWVNDTLFPILRNKVDKDIAASSFEFAQSLGEYKKIWQHNIQSKFEAGHEEDKWRFDVRKRNLESQKLTEDIIGSFSKETTSTLDNGVEYMDFTKK